MKVALGVIHAMYVNMVSAEVGLRQVHINICSSTGQKAVLKGGRS